jgi:hypothetical protein
MCEASLLSLSGAAFLEVHLPALLDITVMHAFLNVRLSKPAPMKQDHRM